MDRSAEIVLSLLREVLHGGTPLALPQEVAWEEVYAFAKAQDVAEVVGKRATAYGLGGGMSDDLAIAWAGLAIKAKGDFERHIHAMACLGHRYETNGLQMLLLKGFGLSVLYPKPHLRLLGDIDIYLTYVDGSHPNPMVPAWQKGDEVIRSLGVKVNDIHEHHTEFKIEGINVENHYDIVNTLTPRSNRWLDQELKRLAEKEWLTVRVEDYDLRLPSPTFNAIFLMRHLGGHFASEKAVLRQLVDWVLLIDHHSDDIDWHYAVSVWRRLGMLSFVRCINSICVRYLGADSRKFHHQLSTDRRRVERVLADIIHPEFHRRPPDGPVLRVIAFKTLRFFANGWKRRMVYKESLIGTFLSGAIAKAKRPRSIGD